MTHLSTIRTEKPSSSLAAALLRRTTGAAPAGVPAHVAVASQHYENIEVSLDPDTATYWCHMAPRGKPIVTKALLRDLRMMQDSFHDLFAAAEGTGKRPFSYYVFASRTPGIYSLGGDLAWFADRVLAGDRDGVRQYAHACVEIVYRNVRAFDLPVVTMALVQGDALGGGFETALSFDLIVAERSATMGLPEILFNLFPGMGAYSFLSRRLDASRAQKLILSGKLYKAEELHEMGLVDVLAEDGQGEAAVEDYVRRMSARHNAQYSLYQARRRVNPVTREELRDVVDIWTDAVFGLTDADLKKMGRIVAAQDRRLGRRPPSSLGVAAE
jgi:DSF synthase